MKTTLLAALFCLLGCFARAQVAAYVPPSIQSIAQVAPTGGSAGAFLRYRVVLAHGSDTKPMLSFPIYGGAAPTTVESSVGYDLSYVNMDVVVSVKSSSVIGAYRLDDLTIIHSGGQTVYKRDGTIQHLFYPATNLPARHSLNFALADFSVVAAGGALPSPVGGGTTVATKSYPTNMSLRVVPSAGQPFIIGFSVTNETPGSTAPARLLVRAVGPGLSRFGLGSPMDDPRLTVNTQTALTIDNWSDTAANAAACEAAALAVGAFPLERGSKDAAVVIDALPGTLTVSVSNMGRVSGDVLIEVYRVP